VDLKAAERLDASSAVAAIASDSTVVSRQAATELARVAIASTTAIVGQPKTQKAVAGYRGTVLTAFQLRDVVRTIGPGRLSLQN